MAKKICIDAGHSGKYNRSPAVKDYYESVAMWKLHLLQKKYLEEYGFEVILTRNELATDKEVYSRGTLSKGCDLFISNHSNAVGSGVNESVDYPVVYVPLNGKGNAIGQKLADCICSVMGTKQKGRIETRKLDSGADYYGVIRGAVAVDTVGLLLEHSFHSNTRSTKWLLDDDNLDKLAKAEADVIADYFGATKGSGTAADTPSASGTLYRVQTGAFTSKTNAENHLAKIKSAGFDTYMVQADGFYKVQVGAYSKKENADAMLKRLKAAGFDAFITDKSGTSVVANVKKSSQEVAKEVIAGKWGNGSARKTALEKAGYNYSEIQNIVNELLK